MNWDAIGALGEIIGAIAVVITLAYLAAQIRSGNRALRTSVRDSAFRQLQDWNNQLVSDPILPLIFQRGMEDFESLDEAERVRFIHLAFSFVKLYENLYLHHIDGSLPEEGFCGPRTVFLVYFNRPGLQKYWAERRDFFDERFVRWVDRSEIPGLKSGSEVSGMEAPGGGGAP